MDVQRTGESFHATRRRATLGRSIAAAIAVLAVASSAWAQPSPGPAGTPIDDPDKPKAPALPVLQDANPNRRPIALAEAIALGLQNNLQVEVERFSPHIAQMNADGAWGAYDPTLSGDIGYNSNSQPVSNAIQAGSGGSFNNDNFVTGGDTQLSTLLPYLGATLGISASGSHTQTNLAIETFSPRYDSGIFFTASVPLLRGLIWNDAWTNVKVSKLAYQGSREDFRTSVMDVVQNIDQAYWNLVASEQQLAVAQKSLETAQALLDQTETQYDVGVVSKVEVIEAEAGVANREFQLITDENRYRSAQDQLINQVFGRQLRANTKLEFRPTDDPQNYITYDIDVVEATRTAFAKRPELASLDLAIESNEVNLRFAKNQRLPQLNLEFSYGYLGLSGEIAPQCEARGSNPDNPFSCQPDPARIGNFGRSYADYFTAEGAENLSVRGVFSIPLLNTRARKAVNSAEFQVRRAESQKAQLEQSIILDVRLRVRNLDSAQRGIVSAERNRAATEEQLRAERIRLEYGESTPFEVLQRESDLVGAESQLITALQVYWTSLTDLARAQGTILDNYKIQIEDVEALR